MSEKQSKIYVVQEQPLHGVSAWPDPIRVRADEMQEIHRGTVTAPQGVRFLANDEVVATFYSVSSVIQKGAAS